MGWVILLVAGSVLGITLFILATDGRYFGKRSMNWAYDRFGARLFSARSESDRWLALADQLQITGNEKILDAGTATGDLPLSIAALPYFTGIAAGIDRSLPMIAAAQQEAERRGLTDKTDFQGIDLTTGLPFADEEFDVVCCFGLLETLPKPGDVLGELARILKADGKLAVSLYKGWSAQTAALDLTWYQTHLAPLGFTQLDVAPCRGNQDIVIAWAKN